MAYFTYDFFSTTEEFYLTQKGKLLDYLRLFTVEAQASVTPESITSIAMTRQSLPRINIPKFSGNYNEWLTFRDLFKSMVIHTSLSPIERMHYLKTNLMKEASALIASVPATAENFNVAWEMLKARYDNVRLLTNSQLATLFSLSAMTTETSTELKALYNGTANAVGALKALGCPIDSCDDFLVYMTVQKLDKQSRRKWEAFVGSKKPQQKALESTTKSRETPTNPKNPSTNSSKQQKKSADQTSSPGIHSHVSSSSTTAQKCALCHQGHFILFFESFREKSADDRRTCVMSNKLCLNCLGHHYVRDCRSKKTCQTCKEKHHSMLHDAYTRPNSLLQATDGQQVSERASTSAPLSTLHAKTSQSASTRVLLAIALLYVSTRNNDKALVRALIDQGSEATFVSESLAQRLNLQRSSTSVIVTGLGASAVTTSRGAVTLFVSSRFNSKFTCQINALVIPKLTAYQLPSVLRTSQWKHLVGLPLADPDFVSSQPIELLLGADVYAHIILDGVRKGAANSPVAQNTQLGWIISGRMALHVTDCSALTSMQVSLDTSLSISLQRFWDQEEVQPLSTPSLPKHAECEHHFASTHSRNSEGRYIVRLPFEKPVNALGDSITTASSMLHRMERRFSRDNDFHRAYSAFMTEYETLGHMELVSQSDSSPRHCYYLSHHGVIRESSTTTKLRVVFNGSQRTSEGLCLNEHLHVGPKLLPELVHILLGWRSHKIVFSADMEKMYRQILLSEKDRDFQRIVWRKSASSTISKYRLCTVTYGLTCAPFLAIRVIHQLAHDEKERYRIGAAAMLTDVYVDDVLSGAESVAAALSKQNEMIALLTAGGLSLQKWTSNAPALLHNVAPKCVAQTTSIDWQPETFHMLGLSWESSTDSFLFKLKNAESQDSLTKRNVLSRIAQLFDPRGWLSPVTILAKTLMQSLWLLKLGWDEPLPAEQARHWNRIYADLPAISKYRIPRWLKTDSTLQHLEVHGFTDASGRAYAAVLYLRVESIDSTSVTLITAKTKVAPVKQVSIPRIELLCP